MTRRLIVDPLLDPETKETFETANIVPWVEQNHNCPLYSVPRQLSDYVVDTRIRLHLHRFREFVRRRTGRELVDPTHGEILAILGEAPSEPPANGAAGMVPPQEGAPVPAPVPSYQAHGSTPFSQQPFFEGATQPPPPAQPPANGGRPPAQRPPAQQPTDPPRDIAANATRPPAQQPTHPPRDIAANGGRSPAQQPTHPPRDIARQDRTKKEGRPDRAKKKSEARPRQKFFGYPAVKDRNNSNPYPA